MPAILADEIKPTLVNERTAGTTFGSLFIALLSGVGAITHASTYAGLIANLTAFTGNTPQSVAGWGGAALNGAFQAVAQAALNTFVNGDAVPTPTINAWMLFSTAGGNKLVCADFYPTPFSIPAGLNYQTAPSWADDTL